MTTRSSYLQRLAAPLGNGPSLYPLAQAAPGEARPQVAAPPVAQPSILAPARETAAPAPTIRRKQAAPAAPTAAARHSQPAIAVTQPEKAAPVLSVFEAAPKASTQTEAEMLESEVFTPAKLEELPAAVTAMPVAAPAKKNSEFEPKTTKPAAPPLLSPAPPALIWGEPIALPPKSVAASPFEPPPPARPPNRQNGGTEIHIGTIEVRSEAATPKAPVPPPAPAPRAAPPPPASPFSRAYGWRFGLSQS